MQKQNLTLTVDAEVLKAARRYALERDTSVNELVRKYLAGLSAAEVRHEDVRKKLREFYRKNRVNIGPITWTRDELHERR